MIMFYLLCSCYKIRRVQPCGAAWDCLRPFRKQLF